MGCSMKVSPPVDGKGNVKPHDHEEIFNDDILIRGLYIHHVKKNPDGSYRLSKNAFSASSKKYDIYRGLSLESKKTLECLNKTVDDWATKKKCIAVACFPAEILREAGVRIGWAPNDGDPGHCNAWGKLGKPFPRTRPLLERLVKESRRRFVVPGFRWEDGT